MKRKVWAYIVREKQSEHQLLVFEHTDEDAGIQIPAGTVDEGEIPETAMHRELLEESGLDIQTFSPLKTIEAVWEGEPVQAHLFAAWAPQDVADDWTHAVTGQGEDKGMRFHYYWLPLKDWNKIYGDFKLGREALDEYLLHMRYGH